MSSRPRTASIVFSAAHAAEFQAAYPSAGTVPKGHWGFHLAPQLLRDGLTIDCFVGERQNHLMKQCAESVSNTKAFETSVRPLVLSDRLGALGGPIVSAIACATPRLPSTLLLLLALVRHIRARR